MIYELHGKLRKKLIPMFDGMDDTVILSCLQGHMGSAWVDDFENPTVAQVTVGIFVFFAGNPNAKMAEELLCNLSNYNLVIVNTDEWKKRIESVHKDSLEKFQRYSFKKNPEHLDKNHIQNLLSPLPEGFELKKIDAMIVKEPSLHALSEDFTAQFDSNEDFINRGVGFVILNGGQVVCGASSFSIYDDGIEIEIATDPRYRRKGLATITASALILDCLDKGIYPSWDAANKASVTLAEKLGYIFKESYDTYFINHEKI